MALTIEGVSQTEQMTGKAEASTLSDRALQQIFTYIPSFHPKTPVSWCQVEKLSPVEIQEPVHGKAGA